MGTISDGTAWDLAKETRAEGGPDPPGRGNTTSKDLGGRNVPSAFKAEQRHQCSRARAHR